MDFVKQKDHRLNQIIKNCKYTESQLVKLKRSLDNEVFLSSPQKLNLIHKSASISLLKNSRTHIEQFDKRQAKMNSLQSIEKLKKQRHSVPLDGELLKKEQNCSKFRKLENTKTIKLRDQCQQKKQPIHQNPDEQNQTSKPKKNYFPQIESKYIQTFSPKNASLSQYSMAQKQLQNSALKKNFDKHLKLYQKQNMLKDYQRKKHKKEETLQLYRLSILKKISYENVKKYLLNEGKSRKTTFDKNQCALSRSWHLQA